MLHNSSILLTGGTGSFGHSFVSRTLKKYKPKRLVIFSRDEMKQWEMAKLYKGDTRVRFFIGDVRDKDRLHRALYKVDYVVHAAATKIVPTAEYNPFECIKTNVNGAMNLIEASIDQNVKKVVALSTDKASSPINLYGASKLASDKLFVASNSSYAAGHKTIFSVVRYGNVVGSRGSVVPLFANQRESGSLTITNPEMTRFLITLKEGVDFVLQCLEQMVGGELYVPKIPACTVGEIANVIAPKCSWNTIGLRPGEKMHEILIPEDEAKNVLEFDNHYVIQPIQSFWGNKIGILGGVSCSEGFRYASNCNCEKFSSEQLNELLADFLPHSKLG